MKILSIASSRNYTKVFLVVSLPIRGQNVMEIRTENTWNVLTCHCFLLSCTLPNLVNYCIVLINYNAANAIYCK